MSEDTVDTRLVRWLYRRCTGEPWPKWAAFDHIDGDPHNNDPENLRIVDIRANRRATSVAKS